VSTDIPVEAGVEERCALASIAYLARNDYDSIRQVAQRTLRAKDGKREVYIWLAFGTASPDGEPPCVAVPAELFRLAKIDRARVDVIRICLTGEVLQLKHMMNAPVPE